MRRFACLAASLWFLAWPVAGTAQTLAADEATSGPYEELLSVLVQSFEGDTQLDRRALDFAQQMVAKLPELQHIEAARPGLTAAIAEAALPVFASHSERTKAAYRPRLLGILKDTISEDEAISALEFYRSDTGRMMRKRLAEIDRAVADGTLTGTISREAVGGDRQALIEHLPVTFTPEERRAMDEGLQRFPVLVKLRRFTTAAMPIRAEIVNAPLSESDFADLTKALGQGWLQYKEGQR